MPSNGTLYIAATPIGNLEDITLRVLRILQEVDLIAAEDTRHTRKLLTHYKIVTPLVSYYREKENERSDELLLQLGQGMSIALVSDAGTPGISDPGAILVQKARKAGIEIIPLPGASALTTALSASGVLETSFLFVGFPPAKNSARRNLLKSLKSSSYPVIFYESPRRIQKLLRDIQEIMGNRNVFWGRELTKKHEELLSCSINQMLEISQDRPSRGEFVLMVHPGEIVVPEGESIQDLLIWYRDNSTMSLKDVSKKLSADLGLSRSSVYQEALNIYKAQDN